MSETDHAAAPAEGTERYDPRWPTAEDCAVDVERLRSVTSPETHERLLALARAIRYFASSPPVGQAPEQAKCECRVVEGEQVTWCKAHNGWTYGRQMDKLRQEAETRIRTVHGVNCPKVMHDVWGGYLHHDEDDGPYDVDGVRYCGRCHVALPAAAQAPEEEREDRKCLSRMFESLRSPFPLTHSDTLVNFGSAVHIAGRAHQQLDRLREDMKRMDQDHARLASALHEDNDRLRSQLEAARKIVRRALWKLEHEHHEECCVYSDDHAPDCLISEMRVFLAPEEDRHE